MFFKYIILISCILKMSNFEQKIKKNVMLYKRLQTDPRWSAYELDWELPLEFLGHFLINIPHDKPC